MDRPVVPEAESVAVVLVYDDCNLAEVLDVAHRIVRGGSRLVYAGVEATVIDQSGLVVKPGKQLEEIDAATVSALVVPGGDPGSVIANQTVLGFLTEAVKQGAIVAGICGGVLLLAAAGVTKDRSITHNYRAPWAGEEIVEFTSEFWNGSNVEPDTDVGVVVDERVITALPTAAAGFTDAVLTLLQE